MTTDKKDRIPNAPVPRLRFPDFFEEYTTRKIGQLTTKVGSGVTPKGGENVYTIEGHPFVRSQNVGNGQMFLEDIAFIDENTHKKQIATEIQKGDVLLNITGASIGRSSVAFDEVVGGNVNQHVCIVRPNMEILPHYLCYLFLSDKGQKQIDSFQAGGNRQGLNFEQIKSFKFSIPTLAEQKKVSDLFCLIDERIKTQSRAIQQLQSLISGITQKVSKHPSAQKTMLSEILIERNEKNKDLLPIYSVSVSEGVVNQVEYLGRSFAAKDTSNYNVVHQGDIVYTKSPTGDFPFGIVKRSDVGDNVAVSPLYGVYQPNNDVIGIYLHYYFCSPFNAKNYLHKLIQKGAKNTINITNQRFLENTIPVPEAHILENYVRLMNVLSGKLILEKDLLLQLQKQKQYLLGAMFI